jgi:hypothetical protein
MNTFKLIEWALPKLRLFWGSRFVEISGKVENMKNIPDGVYISISGVDHTYDWVMDCTGFPSDMKDYIELENPSNHCLVHNIPVGEKTWNYTLHRATKDGWMFGVPLVSRVSYGYLFNNKLTDIESAKRNFSEEIGVPVAELDGIEYRFTSYVARKMVNGRIIKQGNKAVFYEPMFANSLWMYDLINKISYDLIMGGIPEETANGHFLEQTRMIFEVIHFMYHGGSIYDTPFWQYAKKLCSETIDQSDRFKTIVQRMHQQSIQGFIAPIDWGFEEWNLRKIDENLGYNYFKLESALKEPE